MLSTQLALVMCLCDSSFFEDSRNARLKGGGFIPLSARTSQPSPAYVNKERSQVAIVKVGRELC
jgi:hypothetical protein